MKDRAIEFQGAAGSRGPRVGPPLAVLGLMCLLGPWMAGCALTVPMGAAALDEAPTGSIRESHPSPFSPQMDAEDWRRARSALGTALDPQGNGASVAWDNPGSGAKGSFVPLAQVYPKGDGICRLFAARLVLKGEAEQVLSATACRVNSGDWTVGRVAAMSDKDAAPGKAGNLAERGTDAHLK